MIAFSAICTLHSPMSGVYVLPSTRAIPQRISPRLSGHCYAPLWSPTTTKLLFGGAQGEYPGQAAIYCCDTATFLPRALPLPPANNHAMLWISDQHIAFSFNRDNHYFLATTHADGTHVRSILDFDVFADNVSWSADRHHFLVTARDDMTQLHLFAVNGTHVRQWARDSYPKYHLMWSPDARSIAFTTEPEHTAPLYVMSFDGSDLRRIGDAWHDWRFDDRSFTWSPDSRTLAYIGRAGTEEWPVLYTSNPDGTQRQQIAWLNPGDDTGEMRPPRPVWSPDSHQLLWISYDDDQQAKLYLTTLADRVTACLDTGALPFEIIDDLAWGMGNT